MSSLLPNKTKNILVTSALPYANGDLHLGHLVEAVQTDAYVRYQRLIGNRAIYVCADDTHGTPIQLAAIKRGITPEQLVAEMQERHEADYRLFSIGFDMFYTTNSPENKAYAEEIYAGLKRHGLIVEREMEQYFCEKDGRFLPDRFVTGICPRCGAADQYGDVCESCKATYDPTELNDPHCITCGTTPIRKTSSHLFVDLVQCADFLRDYLHRENVLQDDMRNFVMHWVEDGLKPWCISRDAPYFGFPIPDAPGKFFYVWLDAPIGYVSSTAHWCTRQHEDFKAIWGEESNTEIVHFIGKDIVYFHTLFWPVMLKNASLKLPSRIFVHGFLNMNGEKMSKTRGTFILAREYCERVTHPQAAEFLRFYFCSKLSDHAGDLDLIPDELVSRVTTALVNNFGNLNHRTMVFIQKSFNNMLPDAPWDATLSAETQRVAAQVAACYERVDYKSAIEIIMTLGSAGNKYYQDSKPWLTIKTDPAQAAQVMVTCANVVRALGVFLKPIVPGIVAALEKQFGTTLSWNDHIFSLRNMPLGEPVKIVTPLEPEQVATLLGTQGNPPTSAVTVPSNDANAITIDHFKTVDLRIATVVKAQRVVKSDKLLKLQVELDGQLRQIVAGIGKSYTPEAVIGQQVVVVANLKPAKLMGEVSHGMVLAVPDAQGNLVLVGPQREVVAGAKVS